jgi:[ribosomal protein S5]-alanine N-acetyltransferase
MHKIETVSLALRNLVADDASKEYADWLNDNEVNKYLETRHSPQTVQTCRDFIAVCNSDPNSHLFGIFLKSNGRHIGNAKIGFISPIHQSGQISLFIGNKDCWGKGYATQVVQALTAHSIKTLGLKKLEAGCYEDNLGSLRVFLKAGYVVEGFMRSHIERDNRRLGCFWLGILADEFSQ